MKEDRSSLSHLAHILTKIDKFAPETCCVVGNYYSLKGQHEKSIIYFKRALKLNKSFVSAYTLMGHEYIELRNTAAAIHCYRSAISTSIIDYRAWYGLGQTYEMMHLYQYALYYFNKAAALRPDDARMWCAVGNCLHRLGSVNEAVVAFERALEHGDNEGVATKDLAHLYKESGLFDKAAEVYRRHVDADTGRSSSSIAPLPIDEELQFSTSPPPSHHSSRGSIISKSYDTMRDHSNAEGILFLANYYRDQGRYDLVYGYCSRLLDLHGPEGDEAKALLREVRGAHIEHGGAADGPTRHQQQQYEPSSSLFFDEQSVNISGSSSSLAMDLDMLQNTSTGSSSGRRTSISYGDRYTDLHRGGGAGNRSSRMSSSSASSTGRGLRFSLSPTSPE